MSYNYYYFEDKDKNATSTSQEESTITNEIKLNTTKVSKKLVNHGIKQLI